MLTGTFRPGKLAPPSLSNAATMVESATQTSVLSILCRSADDHRDE